MIVDALLKLANSPVEKTALRFIDPMGKSECLTFADLDIQARRISEYLSRQLAIGAPALLAFPPGLEFLPAFLGCLYAGVVAVPVLTPLRAEDRARIGNIAADCKASIGLTARGLAGKLSNPADAHDPALEWLNVEDILESALPSPSRRPARSSSSSSEVAYLQYTSGSTSTPRGVEVTQSGLLHNLRGIVDALALGPDDVCVTWLPHFHDMGLVGTLLAPLFAGASTVIMSPFDFVRSPIKWLKAFTDFRGTFTASPNFGYEFCASRISPEQRVNLDLSNWRAAPNGAEPVRADTIRRFVEAFAPVGFDPAAMAPCYGLAEATLVVSMSRPSAKVSIVGFDRRMLSQGIVQTSNGDDALNLVGCGPPVLGTEIAFVDPVSRRRLTAEAVGEIWVRSGSVARGYRNRNPEAFDGFNAEIESEKGVFLRTGDLGFLHDGELFVTGRIKDLIISRGRNLHPHDIERTAREAHPELAAHRGVAFAIERRDGEGVVILHEAKTNLQPAQAEDVILKVRAAINRVHGVDPCEIALVPRRAIELTSSGKLARWRSRRAWMEGRTRFMARWTREPHADESVQTDPARNSASRRGVG